MYKSENNSFNKMVFLTILLGLTMAVNAQSHNSNSDFWRNVRYGGGLGIGFGNNNFNIAVAPSAIYQFNEQFATGVGLNFNYSKFDDFKFTALGAGIMTFYNPIRSIQLSAEFEQNNVRREETFLGERFTDNYWVPALFLGVGIGGPQVTVGIRYDVLYDDQKSLYINPWVPFIRVYF